MDPPLLTLCCGPDSGLIDLVLPPMVSCERGELILASCPKVFEVLEPPSSFDVLVCVIV